MGLIFGMRETPSSLSPSANSVGNGRSTKDFGFYYLIAVVIGVSLRLSLDLEHIVVVVAVYDPPLICNFFYFREDKAVNIKPMLVRLEGAMDRNDLIEQMVLLPEPASAASKWSSATKSVNLVVGYNASPRSQTALDLTMWIAHQTRLVTQKEVTVQVVYVVDEKQSSKAPDVSSSTDESSSSIHRLSLSVPKASAPRHSAPSVLAESKPQRLAVTRKKKSAKQHRPKKSTPCQAHWFEQADRILWQARCLAEEWRGSFKAHLRFGDVATELRTVVESEAATLLFLGCNSVNHPIVQEFGSNFPCSVLGIPTVLSLE